MFSIPSTVPQSLTHHASGKDVAILEREENADDPVRQLLGWVQGEVLLVRTEEEAKSDEVTEE
jgi:hypothetical protein